MSLMRTVAKTANKATITLTFLGILGILMQFQPQVYYLSSDAQRSKTKETKLGISVKAGRYLSLLEIPINRTCYVRIYT